MPPSFIKIRPPHYREQAEYIPSKLILATLVYLLSEAFKVIGLKCTVIASFCGVGRTLCKDKYI